MLRTIAPLALASTVLLAPHHAAADTCSPARVMVVLDKSSSMQTGKIGAVTKWNVAVDGLGQVLGAYDAKAEFGLMTFPRPNQCGPGQLDVAPALSNRTAILDSLTTPPPNAGNWTPMAETLVVASGEPSLISAAGPRHVVLITDGWQYCSPYDPATRFDGTDAVAMLNAAGVTTWVVGFGAEVDAAALNKMAVAANTARPNCNPASTDAAATDNCYFQVDNSAELVTALTAIAGTIAVEVCDGLDNDCDGQVDEDLTRACSNACGAGTETCSNGTWAGCSAVTPQTETCDGIDNNCDGRIDEADANLCDTGEVCLDGMCQPPNTETGGGTPAGCGCQTQSLDAGAVAPFAALGLLMVLGRRRRRR
jgi:uncharacterized protein (TIGR03382 family)